MLYLLLDKICMNRYTLTLSDASSGGAYDWAKAEAGIKYSYTYELRPDGNSWNGFVVSESEIEPSGEEIWASLAAVAAEL